MKKLTILSILSFCVVSIHAQDKISVSIEKTLIDNQFVAIRTTITNNNNEPIFINIGHSTDDFGNSIGSGGNIYLSLNVYDENNNKVTIHSNDLVYTYDPNYPLLNNKYRIILKKRQSIQKTYRLCSYQGEIGFLNTGCVCKFFEVELHINYIYMLDNSVHKKVLISNRIAFN